MDFKFIWKLIGGDMFEQTFTGSDSLDEALKSWFDYWGVSEHDCEIFKVELIK
jgi:hypothetical protein